MMTGAYLRFVDELTCGSLETSFGRARSAVSVGHFHKTSCSINSYSL